MVKVLDKSNMDDILGNGCLKHSKIAVVKVGAPWCGPCKLFKPHYERWANDHKDESDVTFYELDHDSNPDFIKKHMIDSVPSLFIFVYGFEVLSVRRMIRQNQFETMLAYVRNIQTSVEDVVPTITGKEKCHECKGVGTIQGTECKTCKGFGEGI